MVLLYFLCKLSVYRDLVCKILFQSSIVHVDVKQYLCFTRSLEKILPIFEILTTEFST